jgi:hypothetical protein
LLIGCPRFVPLIPAKRGRRTEKPAKGRNHRLMRTCFDLRVYRRRSQLETVVSMVKRRLEGCVRGPNDWSQRRELRLKVITDNIMTLIRLEVFFRAVPDTFSPSNWLIRQRANALKQSFRRLLLRFTLRF